MVTKVWITPFPSPLWGGAGVERSYAAATKARHLPTPHPYPSPQGEGKESFRIGLVLGPRPVESGQRHAGGIDGDDLGKLVQRNF